MNWVNLLGAAGLCAMLASIVTGIVTASRMLIGVPTGRYEPAFWTLCGVMAFATILRAGLVQ